MQPQPKSCFARNPRFTATMTAACPAVVPYSCPMPLGPKLTLPILSVLDRQALYAEAVPSSYSASDDDDELSPVSYMPSPREDGGLVKHVRFQRLDPQSVHEYEKSDWEDWELDSGTGVSSSPCDSGDVDDDCDDGGVMADPSVLFIPLIGISSFRGEPVWASDNDVSTPVASSLERPPSPFFPWDFVVDDDDGTLSQEGHDKEAEALSFSSTAEPGTPGCRGTPTVVPNERARNLSPPLSPRPERCCPKAQDAHRKPFAQTLSNRPVSKSGIGTPKLSQSLPATPWLWRTRAVTSPPFRRRFRVTNYFVERHLLTGTSLGHWDTTPPPRPQQNCAEAARFKQCFRTPGIITITTCATPPHRHSPTELGSPWKSSKKLPTSFSRCRKLPSVWMLDSGHCGLGGPEKKPKAVFLS